jgi:hypothetical protein
MKAKMWDTLKFILWAFGFLVGINLLFKAMSLIGPAMNMFN